MEHRAECQLPGIEIEKATGRSRPGADMQLYEERTTKRIAFERSLPRMLRASARTTRSAIGS